MNKKAALNLGISTVVVLVIAMVLIGAGVSFIRSVFSDVPMPGDIIDPATLSNPPTRERPLIIDGSTIRVGQTGGESVVRVGVYNSQASTANDVQITASSCEGMNPEIRSIKQSIPGSSAAAFQIIFKTESNTSAGTYICNIEAKDNASNLLGAQQAIVYVEG
ncbi:MAG: hypothetical protein ACMXX9_04010 [Candidatus Woesearchaeota archaeon]